MSSKVLSFDDEKLLRSYDKIGRAMVECIANMDLSYEIEIARRVYFGRYLDILGSRKCKGYKPFIQWLIFSYKLHNGHSLIDITYENCIKKMNKYEIEALSSLRNTHESLYKVYCVEPDFNKIQIKDVFTNEMMYVWDSQLSNNVKRYAGIFMRLVSLNNRLIPVPGYSIMTNSFLKEIERYIMEKFSMYKKYDSQASIDKFIRSNSLMIHRYFLQHVI